MKSISRLVILTLMILIINIIPNKSYSNSTIEYLDSCIELETGFIKRNPTLKPIANQIAEDVLKVWILWLKDRDIPKTDKRWIEISNYSYYVAESVLFYQFCGVHHGRKIYKLPKHYNTHILIASMVIVESKLQYKVKGKIGEVGLLQVHRHAKNGHESTKIQNNPQLGIQLGVRWLTIHMAYCRMYNTKNWKDEKWIGPVSAYCAGLGKVYKKGRCTNIKVAWKRINLIKRYRRRIMQMDFEKQYGTLSSGGD